MLQRLLAEEQQSVDDRVGDENEQIISNSRIPLTVTERHDPMTSGKSIRFEHQFATDLSA